MTTEVQALPADQIERPAATAPAPQGLHEDSQAQPAPMSTEAKTALARVEELKVRFSDPTLTNQQREQAMKRISELQRFAAGNAEKPAWHEPKPDVRMTDTRPYDSLGDTFADAAKPVTAQELEQVTNLGKLLGLNPEQVNAVGKFAQIAELGRGAADQVVRRVAHHAALGALVEPLSEADRASLHEESVRRFGSVEKYEAQNSLARAFIEHIGFADWVDQHAGSLQFDPALIMALAYRARLLGLKAK